MRTEERVKDARLQETQQQFLSSAIPILQVLEKLNAARSEGNDVDVMYIIRTLSDSLGFIGAANLHMVKARRDTIKRNLPPKWQGLAREDAEFTGALLFGDNLSQNMKELAEVHKDVQDLRGSPRFPFRGRARSMYPRSGYRGWRRPGYYPAQRFARGYSRVPYGRSASYSPYARGAKNSRRPQRDADHQTKKKSDQ